jgi:hypothetical protein
VNQISDWCSKKGEFGIQCGFSSRKGWKPAVSLENPAGSSKSKFGLNAISKSSGASSGGVGGSGIGGFESNKTNWKDPLERMTKTDRFKQTERLKYDVDMVVSESGSVGVQFSLLTQDLASLKEARTALMNAGSRIPVESMEMVASVSSSSPVKKRSSDGLNIGKVREVGSIKEWKEATA